jgi:DNA-binding CsgD family transcriptional regulator
LLVELSGMPGLIYLSFIQRELRRRRINDLIESHHRSEAMPLATVTARFGADTDPLITALRGGGWHRVMVCAPTGAAEQVLSAVRAGATGVLTAPGNAFRPPATHHLTEREIQVITQVAQGCANKDIGTRMSLSSLTVKNHLARIGRKLGTGDRAQIVALACRAGILD